MDRAFDSVNFFLLERPCGVVRPSASPSALLSGTSSLSLTRAPCGARLVSSRSRPLYQFSDHFQRLFLRPWHACAGGGCKNSMVIRPDVDW